MVQIIEAGTPKKPSFGQRLNIGVGRGLEMGQQLIQQHQQRESMRQLGLPENVSPEIAKQLIAERMKGQLSPLQQSQKALADERLVALKQQQDLYSRLASGGAPPEEGTPSETGLRGAGKDLLEQAAAFAGQPGEAGIIGNKAKSELDRREKQATEKRIEERDIRKEERADVRAKEKALRTEVAPIKKEISDRAELARRGIKDKEKLIDIINTGNINDPTYATILEKIPFNLGKRLLSNETVEYKAGLVQNYGDLKTLFTGATRVKEIEILEEKIPDLYLTDQQKKQILLSSIDSHKADILREEAAAEIEEEGKLYGPIQYRKEVDKRVKPKLDALANRVIDQQKAIIRDAENMRGIQLDPSDPEHMEIATQILNEAGGDRTKARALAKKKGYKF